MRLSSNELPCALRCTQAHAVVGYAAPALAQDAQDQSNQQLETITVTGSNIRHVDIETSNPVITIDRAAIQKTGKLDPGRSRSAAAGGHRPEHQSAGQQLRRYGFVHRSSRPRLAPHAGADQWPSLPPGQPERHPGQHGRAHRSPDLDGASSVYGSDAVAGVVNFILRSDYQGAEFSANYGISDKDDGESKGYEFTFGHSTDKGSIMAGINYNKTEHRLAGHRDFSKNSVSLYGTNGLSPYGRAYGQQVPTGSIGGSTSSPFGHIQTPAAFQDIYPCAFLARNWARRVSTSRPTITAIATTRTPRAGSDKYNFATVNLIMTPQERTGLFLNGNYKLTDTVEVYASVMHNKTSSVPARSGRLYVRGRRGHLGRQLLQPVRRRLPQGRLAVRRASGFARQSPRRVRHLDRPGLDGPQGLVRRVERPAVELGSRHGLRPHQPVHDDLGSAEHQHHQPK